MLKKVESFVAAQLIKAPFLKKMVKYSYQFVWDKLSSVPAVTSTWDVFEVNNSGEDTFFGYFDKFPENSNSLVLFHSTPNTKKKPKDLDHIKVCVKNTISDEIVFSTTTRAFNWQQGARTHWLDDDRFCFNDYNSKTDSYICRVINLNTSEEVELDFPVADSLPTRNMYLSLDYKILSKIRPDYGYFAHEEMNNLIDGIYLCSFDSKIVSKKIISTSSVLKLLDLKNYESCKFNHIMSSPDSNSFIFLFRVYDKGVRYDYLGYYDLIKNQLKFIKTGRIVSHCCWINNDIIVGYLENSEETKGYFSLSVSDPNLNLMSKLTDVTTGDGHPSYSNGYILTDSYPNRKRLKSLLLYNYSNESTEVIGSFYESIKYFGETRCDLHPRLSVDGGGRITCYIDSVHSGKRSLYKLSRGSQ